MKDAINNAHGFGCHCRNCHFASKSVTRNGNFADLKCDKGILKAIHYRSFCSEGKPDEDPILYNMTELVKNNIS